MAIVEEITGHEPSKAEQLKNEGNQLFGHQKYQEAIDTYNEALSFCPPEQDKDCYSKIYSNIAACHLKLKEYEKAVEACDQALKVGAFNEKPLIRRGETYKEMGKYLEAIADFNEVLDKYPDIPKEAKDRMKRYIGECEQRQKEEAEKLKDEMVSKMKDLGNMILRPFGLSTDSFQLNDDGKGGMSISMKQPEKE